MVLAWLGLQPKTIDETPAATAQPTPSSYLTTGGVEIEATDPRNAAAPLRIEAGARIALQGADTYRKHYFCDWLLGFANVPGGQVTMRTKEKATDLSTDRTQMASVLGRSPLLYGETIQESLLYRTQHVRKQDLYYMIERLYGPSLRARTSPQNPLVDPNGMPVPTQILTAREHIEIAQINVILQKTPLVVLDLSSELMTEALNQGFRPSPELLESGKTILLILPPNKDAAWAESLLGQPVTTSLAFD